MSTSNSNIIGLDTLRVRLSDYEIAAHPSLTLEHSPTELATGAAGANYRLWKGVEGRKAFHNAEHFNVTIKPNNPTDPTSIGCFVQFAVPKLAAGDNYYPADRSTTGAALDLLERGLADIGIKTNPRNALLTRLDATRNVSIEEPYGCYRPVFAMLQGSRMVGRQYGETGSMWGNTQQQLAAYDKLQEMAIRKVSTVGLPLTARLEVRYLNGRKIYDMLGMKTVREVLADFDAVETAYRDAMRKQLFRYDAPDVARLVASEIAADMRYFQQVKGREWLSWYLKAYGLHTLLNLADIETIKAVVSEVSGSRMKTSRIARELDSLRFQGESLRIVAGSRRTVGSLYDELQEKVLS